MAPCLSLFFLPLAVLLLFAPSRLPSFSLQVVCFSLVFASGAVAQHENHHDSVGQIRAWTGMVFIVRPLALHC